jgi:hypothetical protein
VFRLRRAYAGSLDGSEERLREAIDAVRMFEHAFGIGIRKRTERPREIVQYLKCG